MTDSTAHLDPGENVDWASSDADIALIDAGQVQLECSAPLLELADLLEQQSSLRAVHPQIFTRVASMRSRFGFKRATDVLLSSAALVVLAPVFGVVAIAIKLSSDGPVLFRQARTGLDSQKFEIFKFRTLYAEQTDPSGVLQTRPMDPRVTPLGRVLRRWNIDELPQLLNVLKGEMSLVGPRPHVPDMLANGRLYSDLVPHYYARHCVRPGLTGLAQINGFRGPTEDAFSARARVEHDLAYVETWSHWLDLKILLATIVNECFRGRGV